MRLLNDVSGSSIVKRVRPQSKSDCTFWTFSLFSSWLPFVTVAVFSLLQRKDLLMELRLTQKRVSEYGSPWIQCYKKSKPKHLGFVHDASGWGCSL